MPGVRPDDLAIAFDGGGARAAYQVGLLRWLARHYPNLRIPIITGLSAGAINAVFLASHTGTPMAAVNELAQLWSELTLERVFRVDSASLMGNMWHWGLRLVAGGGAIAPPLRGMVDTAPLRHTLEQIFHAAPHGEIAGIARNLEEGRLRGLAIMTSSYATGRAVAWVQGCDMEGWDRPFRESVKARITVDHVMASASLPILFPATRLNGAWYGDGGLRLSSPLSPALHLGANRILAVSTRHDRGHAKPSLEEQYPPPLQIAGQILNAIYLDDNDREAFVLERMNRLLAELPPEKRHGMRVIDLVQIRPSQDIGRLAAKFEPQLPLMFRHLVRGLGSRTSADPDLLSMLIFEPGYLKELIEIGEADAGARAQDIARLVGEA
ncbi:MAG: patatin-like phospholipase family protein [Vicinamibacterales bacterium]